MIVRKPLIPNDHVLITPNREINIDWRRNFDRMRMIGDAWKEIYPYTDEVRVDLNHLTEYPDKPYLLWWASDMHIGNVDTAYDALQKDIDLIENTPNTGLITVGDDVDMGILPRFEVRFMQAFPPYMQAFTMEDIIAEFNGRNPRGKQLVLAHVIGNHTHTLMEQSGILFEKFYEKSKAGILPGIGEVFVTLGNQTYEIALAHRYTGTSRLNVTLAPKRLMEFGYPNADIAVVGHQHKTASEKFMKGGKWHTAVRPGTYRVGTDLFEKARGWGAGQLGGVCSLLYPDHKDTETFMSLEAGIDRLKNFI